MHKDDLLPTGVYEVIRLTGSQRPRMYGLPKIHKKDVPFRPILSMTGSAQHQLATWLTSILQPVLSLYSSYCIQDSFSFVDAIRSSNLQPASTFMCSFDISSLFTNVPLAETIQICADSLYNFSFYSSNLPTQRIRGAYGTCYLLCRFQLQQHNASTD